MCSEVVGIPGIAGADPCWFILFLISILLADFESEQITLQDVMKTTNEYIEEVVGECETLYLGKKPKRDYPDFGRLLEVINNHLTNAVQSEEAVPNNFTDSIQVN